MESFLGLMKKEWIRYRMWLLLAIVVGLTILLIIPYTLDIGELEERFIQEDTLYVALAIQVLMLGNAFSISQFFVSIRADLRVKEIWLHSTSSIAQLIGVKIVFTVLCYSVFNVIFTSISAYFLQAYMEATLGQLLLAQLLTIGMMTMYQLFFLIILLLFFTLYLQLKCFMGRFSIILSMAAFFFSMYVCFQFTESRFYSKVFKSGEIPLSALQPYLPTPISPMMDINLGSLYAVEEIVSLLLFVLIYILATKWFEKVVLR